MLSPLGMFQLSEVFGLDDWDSEQCVACLEEPRDTILLPCRHLCICKDCAEVIKHMQADSNMRNRCPMCRAMASHFIHLDNKSGEEEEEKEGQDQS